MGDDVEDLLERAGRVHTRPVDPEQLWTDGVQRRRARRAATGAVAGVLAVVLGIPVGLTAYRELSPSPGVDVAEGPDAAPGAAAACAWEVAAPDRPVERGAAAAAVAAVLAEVDALPAAAPDRFGDDDGTGAEEAIDQLAALGVLEGTTRSPDDVAPGAPLTRAQLASLLVRSHEAVAGERLDAPDDLFDDDDGIPHERDIGAAVAVGLVARPDGDGFAPLRAARGHELARGLERLHELLDPGRCGG